MIVHQMLYGYRDGHRLISSSFDPKDSINWELVRKTDRPSVSKLKLASGITFGFPLTQDSYALCRTWAAKEISRPGAVWTHVLVLPKMKISPLDVEYLLSRPTTPDLSRYSTPLEIQNLNSTKKDIPLSKEATNLLLLFASRPNSPLRVLSKANPIDLLMELSQFPIALLNNQPFSTDAGKVDISTLSNSVVFSTVDDPISFSSKHDDIFHESYTIPSSRIRSAWNVLNHSSVELKTWLDTVLSSLEPSVTSLKTCFEALLIGKEELDDSKLLARIYSATLESGNKALLKYVSGEKISAIPPPPRWITAIYLLTIEEWGVWEEVVSLESIAWAALEAPVTSLIEGVTNNASSLNKSEVLKIIAKKIDKHTFQDAAELSDDFVKILIRFNRELVYSLPQRSSLLDRHIGHDFYYNSNNLEKEIDFVSRAPFFIRNFLNRGLRLSRGDKVFINYSREKMLIGEWDNIKKSTRDFLMKTPNFLTVLTLDSPEEPIIDILYKEFGEKAMTNFISNNLTSKKKVAAISKILVWYYGADKNIPLSQYENSEMFLSLVEEVSNQRWEKSNSKQTLECIIADIDNFSFEHDSIQKFKNKELAEALVNFFKEKGGR